jgi:hypothetical protein
MKKSTKVVLFSLLVFPGAGHFLLRKWKWGLFFLIATFAPVCYVVIYAYNRAQSIMDRIITGEIPMDPAVIRTLIYEKPTGTETFLLGIAHVVLLACWLSAVGHAWMKAKSQETDPSE